MRSCRTLSFLLALLPAAASALEISGPARISDGDTLAIGSQVIRLYGIDAFEDGQAPHGKRATDALRSLVVGGVRCSGTEYDAYDRLIATCFADDDTDVNEAQVLAGHALAYRKYSTTYVEAEDRARAAGAGAWKREFVPPWEFRRARWESAVQEAPDARCPIKGNISGNGRIYHAPWSRWYSRTKINTRKGERWFCTEAEALAAGWRAPLK